MLHPGRKSLVTISQFPLQASAPTFFKARYFAEMRRGLTTENFWLIKKTIRFFNHGECRSDESTFAMEKNIFLLNSSFFYQQNLLGSVYTEARRRKLWCA